MLHLVWALVFPVAPLLHQWALLQSGILQQGCFGASGSRCGYKRCFLVGFKKETPVASAFSKCETLTSPLARGNSICERVEELGSWSIPSSGERMSFILDYMVDSARSKLFIAGCEPAAAWIITQNASCSSGRQTWKWILSHNNVVSVTLKLRRRSAVTVLSNFS